MNRRRTACHSPGLDGTYFRVLLISSLSAFVFGFGQWLFESRGPQAAPAGALALLTSSIAATSAVPGSQRHRVQTSFAVGALTLVLGAAPLLDMSSTKSLAVLAVCFLFGVRNGANCGQSSVVKACACRRSRCRTRIVANINTCILVRP
jgi:hypothetical protein